MNAVTFLQVLAGFAGVILSIGGLMFVNGVRSISEAIESAWKEYLDARVRAASVGKTLDEILKPNDASLRLKDFATWEGAEKAIESKLNENRDDAWDKFLRLVIFALGGVSLSFWGLLIFPVDSGILPAVWLLFPVIYVSLAIWYFVQLANIFKKVQGSLAPPPEL